MTEQTTVADTSGPPLDLADALAASISAVSDLPSSAAQPSPATGADAARGARTASSSGGIIVERIDPANLDALLEQHREAVKLFEGLVAARGRTTGTTLQAASHEHARTTALVPAREPWRVASASAIAAALTGAGVVLLISSLIDNGLSANPFVALVCALGGAVLLATVVVALRDRG